MSNLENKLKKIVNTFNNVNWEVAFKDIKNLSENYYKNISDGLLISALKNIPKSNQVKIIKVPGVFEIPVTISKNLKKFDAFLALGCVIKGQTPHFDFISQASTNAIMDISVSQKKPVGNGIITCLNMKQAKARKNKGAEAANAVVTILKQKWRLTLNQKIILE